MKTILILLTDFVITSFIFIIDIFIIYISFMFSQEFIMSYFHVYFYFSVLCSLNFSLCILYVCKNSQKWLNSIK